jgi:hypothetical protein
MTGFPNRLLLFFENTLKKLLLRDGVSANILLAGGVSDLSGM